MLAFYKKSLFATFMVVFYLAVGLQAYAQSGGSSTSVTGTVLDPSGAVVPNATVEIHNPVSHFDRIDHYRQCGKVQHPERSVQSLPPQCHGAGLR